MDGNPAKRYYDKEMRWRWQLTTIWTDGHVYLFLSENSDERPRTGAWRMIKSSMCTAHRYASLAEDLLRDSGPGQTRRVWSVLQQSFPFGSFEEIPGKGYGRIPDWLEACWITLPRKLLPHAIHGGIDAMKHHFENSGYAATLGCGLYSAYNGRGYFMGHDEKETFVRVSKDALWLQSDCMGLNEDWLQQTGMLYRNKTGCELSKVYLMQDNPATLTQSPGSQVVIESTPPTEPRLPAHPDLPAAIRCIGLATMQTRALDDLNFQTLEDRYNHMVMDSAFKWGTCLLLIGWVALFLTACKGVTPHESAAELMREWEDARKTWDSCNEIFHKWSADLDKKRIELSLMGLIGQSVPSSFSLKRVAIRQDPEDGKAFLVSLAGNLNPDQSPGSFKEWLDHLINAGIIDHVKDLKFDQSGSVLKVFLEGECVAGNTIL